MNLANKLTMARIFMVPLFLGVLYLRIDNLSPRLALLIFILACITDFLDGYVARKFNQITDFGKFMDPLADKMLVVAAMAWFVEVGIMPAWALMVVLGREFAVSGLRMVAADKGIVIAAGWSGKVKTAVTMVALIWMLYCPLLELYNQICVGLIVATTLYSGIEYFVKNKDVLKEGTTS